MIHLTDKAVEKIKSILAQQDPIPAALRFGCQGGGCSGLNYVMQFENEKGPMDKEFDFPGLKVFVDATSFLYLDGCTVDYLETLESSGFRFSNPNASRHCGCGSSFSV
jgi:iron-sulfur cluster assembly accessory protein